MPDKKKPHHLKGRTGRRANAFKPQSVRRMDMIRMRCNADEQKRFDAAAAAAGKSLSVWIRDILLANS